MTVADNALALILTKTRSSKLQWNRGKATIEHFTLMISLADDEDKPLLRIYCGEFDAHFFSGAVVDELFEEVNRQQFFQGPAAGLLSALDDH